MPWEILYANDLILIASSLEAMESKDLRVNMKKTQFMVSGLGMDALRDSGNFPCTACHSGIGANSILCTQCNLSVHKKCSKIPGRATTPNPGYVCPLAAVRLVQRMETPSPKLT